MQVIEKIKQMLLENGYTKQEFPFKPGEVYEKKVFGDGGIEYLHTVAIEDELVQQ